MSKKPKVKKKEKKREQMVETSNLVLFCVIWLLTCEPRAFAFSCTANLLSCFMDAFCKWFSWLSGHHSLL